MWCDARSLKSSLERTDRHDMTKMSMKSASITYEDPALLAQKLQADHRLSEQALANFLISAKGVPIIIQDLSLWTTNEAGIQHDDALSAVTRRSRRDEDDDSASVAPFRNNDSFAGLGNSLLQPFEDEEMMLDMEEDNQLEMEMDDLSSLISHLSSLISHLSSPAEAAPAEAAPPLLLSFFHQTPTRSFGSVGRRPSDCRSFEWSSRGHRSTRPPQRGSSAVRLSFF